MPALSSDFLRLDGALADYDRAAAVVLPVPYERTTSYGKGTVAGPDAIVRASYQVELYDEELDREPCEQGVATAPFFSPEAFDLGEALQELEEECHRHLAAGKFLVTLGGEHGLTTAPVRAARRVHGEIGVVQFDAHADLRPEYEGTPWSHASVMRRLVEDGFPTLAVGLRAYSREEAELIRERRLPVIPGRDLEGCDGRFAELLAGLPERVYLTFDVDFFDPALLPATGTPEPGGGFWTPTLRLLRHLFTTKTVVAMDVVELAPRADEHASDFVAARLVYKCLGYRLLRSPG